MFILLRHREQKVERRDNMKRKIYDRLLEWKERDKGSCAILIDGARRVGKSYIAEQFGRNESAALYGDVPVRPYSYLFL